jgi:hypothetical protein
VKLLGISLMWSLIVLTGAGCTSRQPAIGSPEDVCAHIISGIAAKSSDNLHAIGRNDIVYYYQSNPGEGNQHRGPERQLTVAQFTSRIQWSLNVKNAIDSVSFDTDSGTAIAHWIGRGDSGLVARLRVKFHKNGPWHPTEVHLYEQCIKTK